MRIGRGESNLFFCRQVRATVEKRTAEWKEGENHDNDNDDDDDEEEAEEEVERNEDGERRGG